MISRLERRGGLSLYAGGALFGAALLGAVVEAGTVPALQPRAGDPLPDLTAAELQRFLDGRVDYITPLAIVEGLGPIFNDTHCGTCHDNPIGGTGTKTVTRFGSSGKGGFDPLEMFGGSLLQSQAISLECQEEIPVPQANITAMRVTNGMMGYGLVEAIEDSALLANESTTAPITGRAHLVFPVETPATQRVGRFGWKAGVATILTFSADASLNEMGLTNRFFMQENDPNGINPPDLIECTDGVPDPDDGPDAQGRHLIDRVTDFQRFMAQPPQTPKSGMAGEGVFNTVGCNQCHVAAYTTPNDMSLEVALRNKAIRPYSDFLLHEMGLGADGIADGMAGQGELRTPPLWGVRRRDPVWHDGRFGGGSFEQRMTDAINEHGLSGSEAIAVVAAFNGLSPGDKTALFAFLDSLGKLEFDGTGDDLVDAADFLDFDACYTGPGAGSVTPDDPCAVHDIDQDGDVDDDDYGRFVEAYLRDGGTAEDCNSNGMLDFTDILDGTSEDLNGSAIPDECECLNDCFLPTDGQVDVGDLLRVLALWGQTVAECDTNFDGVIDVVDLNRVLGEWGACP